MFNSLSWAIIIIWWMLQWLWTWYLEREDWYEIELQSWPDSSGRSYETLSRCSEQNPNTTDCDRWTCWFGWSETRTWAGDVSVSGRWNVGEEILSDLSPGDFGWHGGCESRLQAYLSWNLCFSVAVKGGFLSRV